MLKELLLLFLVSFYACNVNFASENVPLEVRSTVSLKKISFFIFCSVLTIIILRKIIFYFYPTNDGSYNSFEKKLMLQNDQKFFGEIPQSINNIIHLLKLIPSVQSPNYFKSFFNSNSVGIDPDLHTLLQKGYLIHGPSGHGKNFVIQEMKNILTKDQDDLANGQIPFMLIHGDLNTKYVGGAADNWKKTIDDLKRHIKKSPKRIGFLVIDECEQLFFLRGKDNYSGSIVNNILSTVDGFNTDLSCKLIIIGLTNMPDCIDLGIMSRCHTIRYTQSKENLKRINKDKLASLEIDSAILAEFCDKNGKIVKFFKPKSFLSNESSLGYAITPRDLDWISSEIFVQWASEQKRDNNKTQSQLVKEFKECSCEDKDRYFQQAFTIDWKASQPLLYSNNIK
jgi:Asp-tRNA(Asn)/Glu-tRNA(Gln) amidotransferase C subunit